MSHEVNNISHISLIYSFDTVHEVLQNCNCFMCVTSHYKIGNMGYREI